MHESLRTIATSLFLFTSLSMPTVADTVEGFTEPFRKVDVSAGEPGVITSIDVEPGQVVARGDTLLSLDTSVLEATLAMARQRAGASGAVNAARAELTLRRERLEQIKTLRERGHATQRELSRAATDVKIAVARLKLAEEEALLNQLDCKRIEAQIARRKIRSPLDAVVAEVHREVGEANLVTEPAIITLVQLKKLRVRFPLTPVQITQLSEDQEVALSLPDVNKKVRGRIQRIAPVLDAKSGTLEVNIVINNENGKLRSGTRCLLRLKSTLPASLTSTSDKRLSPFAN